MKLTSKITEKRLPLFISFIIVAGMLILFLPIIYFSISQVSSKGETTYTEDEVNRAENVFKYELRNMDSSLKDYTVWDDTYQFAQDANTEYLENNLQDSIIANLNIDIMLILDKENELVFGKNVDRNTITEISIPFDLQDLYRKYPEILENDDINDSHLGFGQIDGLSLMIASRPITNSQFTGQPSGSMIFIRILDEELLKEFSELTMRNLSFFSTDTILAEKSEIPMYNELRDQIYIQPNGIKSISGFKYINDLNAYPSLIMEVNNPRVLHLQGQNSFAITSGAFLLLGIILFYGVYRFTGSFIQSRKEIQTFLERFQSVVNQSRDCMLQVDSKGQIISINPAGEQLLGWKLNESEIGILDSILSFDPSLNEEYVRNLCLSGKIAEHHCARNDGQEFDIELSATFIPDAQPVAYSIVMRDITNRKKAENELKLSEERYMLAANGANDGLWDWNYLTGEIYYSKRWKMMLGFSEDEIKSSPDEWLDRVHPEDIIRLHKKISNLINQKNDIFKSEHRVMKKDGHYCWMMSRGIAVRDSFGNVTRIAGSQTDITDRKKVEEQLRHDALHDGLTGLANRLLLINNLTLVNERKKRNPELMFALLFLDLDRFKQINDTYGHAAGDYVLIEASRRLDAAIRSSDSAARFTSSETLSRIAGDEFVILLEDFKEMVDVQIIYQRLAEELNSPYYYHGNEIRLSASYGLVIPEAPYDNVEDIIRDADIAMYRAKQLGGSQVVQFNQGMYQGTLVRMQLESDMRKGLEQNEFELYYQPIYDLADNRISGFEALIRWNHPERGLLLPGEFIQIAEETGLIVPMGYFVIEEACRRMQSWKEGAITTPDISISVNISAKQLLGTNLVPKIQEILDKTGFDAKNLWLELTESIVVEFNAEVIECLKTIRAMGIHIVIDDFGTGYSSLSYLQNLPVDGFKIDRSFTSDIQEGGQQIIRSLVDLGHSLGLMQVAEGVETQFQKDYLTSLSCDYAQGFLMSRPMNAGAIEELVKALGAKESPQTIQNM